jgi:hypothetical protein
LAPFEPSESLAFATVGFGVEPECCWSALHEIHEMTMQDLVRQHHMGKSMTHFAYFRELQPKESHQPMKIPGSVELENEDIRFSLVVNGSENLVCSDRTCWRELQGSETQLMFCITLHEHENWDALGGM